MLNPIAKHIFAANYSAQWMLDNITRREETIWKMKVDFAIAELEQFIQAFFWTDDRYSEEATNMRRAYEQARDGLALLKEMRPNGSQRLVQVTCELTASLQNYMRTFGVPFANVDQMIFSYAESMVKE